MPYYGLKFKRDVEYANGYSNTAFIRIIECSAENAVQAGEMLRSKLQEFINAWNNHKTGFLWADLRAKRDAAQHTLREITRDAGDDLSFLSGISAVHYRETYNEKAEALQDEINNLNRQITATQEKSLDALHTSEDTGKRHDLPEWREISGFGALSIQDLMGSLSYDERDILSQPQFEIIPLEQALEILEKSGNHKY